MKKKKVILICIGVFLLSTIGWCYWVVSGNSKMYDDIYTEYSSTLENANNALVVYQPSRTVFSEEVATDIAKGLNDTGYHVVVTTPNDKLTKDLSQYQVVVFGTPIYMGQCSSSLKTYINSIENFGDAKLYFYSIGMLESAPEFKEMEEILQGKNMVDISKISKSNIIEDKEHAYKYGRKAGEK